MSRNRSLLEAAEAEAVRAAVASAEARSGAEIVTVVEAAADDHPEAVWKGAALGALLGAAGAASVLALRPPWGGTGDWPAAPALVGALLGALLGALAVTVPTLKRALVGRARLVARAERAARAAFLAHAVFATRQRTGVLIYVARFERAVCVLADEGVHAAVSPAEWSTLADAVAARMGSGPPAAALLDAVERAATLVAARGPRRQPEDANELPDAPFERP